MKFCFVLLKNSFREITALFVFSAGQVCYIVLARQYDDVVVLVVFITLRIVPVGTQR